MGGSWPTLRRARAHTHTHAHAHARAHTILRHVSAQAELAQTRLELADVHAEAQSGKCSHAEKDAKVGRLRFSPLH